MEEVNIVTAGTAVDAGVHAESPRWLTCSKSRERRLCNASMLPVVTATFDDVMLSMRECLSEKHLPANLYAGTTTGGETTTIVTAAAGVHCARVETDGMQVGAFLLVARLAQLHCLSGLLSGHTAAAGTGVMTAGTAAAGIGSRMAAMQHKKC